MENPKQDAPLPTIPLIFLGFVIPSRPTLSHLIPPDSALARHTDGTWKHPITASVIAVHQAGPRVPDGTPRSQLLSGAPEAACCTSHTVPTPEVLQLDPQVAVPPRPTSCRTPHGMQAWAVQLRAAATPAGLTLAGLVVLYLLSAMLLNRLFSRRYPAA
jgi:hypothetical protein